MNKKGIEFQTLLMMIIMGFVMYILIVSIFPVFQQKAEAAIEKGECELTVLLAALVQAGSFGSLEVPPACKMKEVIITEKDLSNRFGYADNRFSVYSGEKYEGVLKTFLPEKRDDENTLYEFALDHVMAEELDDCWDKVVRGRLPIYGRDFFKGSVNCIICSEIRFDDEVISIFGGRRIGSLPEWMQVNPLPGTQIAYWEYITEGQTAAESLFAPRYEFVVSKTPLAVVFVNMRQTTAQNVWNNVEGWLGETPRSDVNMMRIVPFTQQSISGELGCDPTRMIQ